MQTKASKLEAAVLRALLFAALKAEGIEELTISFDGSGDSGQLVPYGWSDNKSVDLGALCNRHGLPVGEYQTSAIEQLCYDALSRHHDGWENDAGAWGSFTFTTEGQIIEYEHWQRYVTETLHQHEL